MQLGGVTGQTLIGFKPNVFNGAKPGQKLARFFAFYIGLKIADFPITVRIQRIWGWNGLFYAAATRYGNFRPWCQV